MLKWNLYCRDPIGKIAPYNIFKHSAVRTDVEKLFEDRTFSKSNFSDALDKIIRYHFWGRAEAEIAVSSWVPHITIEEMERVQSEYAQHIIKWKTPPYRVSVNIDSSVKINIYEQVHLNWESFIDYVWKEYIGVD